MRIALFHNLPSGGAKRAIYETVRRLSLRHAVDVFTLSTSEHTLWDLRPLVRDHRVYPFRPHHLFRSPLGRLNALQRWRDLLRLEAVSQLIAMDIEQNAYDVAYVHPCMWTQAPPVLRYLRTASVYHIHEPLRWAYERPVPRPYLNTGCRGQIDRIDPLRWLYRRRLTSGDQLSTLKATRVLANSRFTAANVRRIYGREAPVCYFGVNTSAFRPLAHRPETECVLSVGALRPEKGFDFLINALAEIPSSRRPRLQIVANACDPRERAYLVSLAERTRVNCVIEEGIDEQALVHRYNEAALLVYAPLREPFGLVPLEAMACAKAVVAVAEGGVLETIIPETTGLLIPRCPKEFGRATQGLFEDPGRRQRMGRTARQVVVRNWRWDDAVRRVERYLVEAADASE